LFLIYLGYSYWSSFSNLLFHNNIIFRKLIENHAILCMICFNLASCDCRNVGLIYMINDDALSIQHTGCCNWASLRYNEYVNLYKLISLFRSPIRWIKHICHWMNLRKKAQHLPTVWSYFRLWSKNKFTIEEWLI